MTFEIVLLLCRYDGYTGLIADELLGLGFGFPEQWTDPEGFEEFRVGFNDVFFR